MLLVRTEYKKGVLFVRLIGRIDNESYIKEIKKIIQEFGIKFTVINTTNLNDVSKESIKKMIINIKKLKKKKHLLFICDENRLKNNYFIETIPKLNNEREAFSLINRKGAYE